MNRKIKYRSIVYTTIFGAKLRNNLVCFCFLVLCFVKKIKTFAKSVVAKAYLCNDYSNVLYFYCFYNLLNMGLFDFFKKKTSGSAPITNTEQKPLQQFYLLTVDKVTKETDQAVSIYFSIPPELSTVFRYQAGQYVTLRHEINGSPVLRSYSLSSCPDTDSFFRIGVKQKLGGQLSGILTQNVAAGHQLSVFPPLGNFTVAETKASHYFLMAGGSGITPILSIAKNILYRQAATITLLYANRSWEAVMYADELRQLAEQYPQRLKVVHILDEVPTSDWQGEKGVWQEQNYVTWLRSFDKQQLSEAAYFICGPTQMMQAVESALRNGLSIPAQQVHIEYFDMSQQQQVSAKTIAPTVVSATASQGSGIALIQLQGKQYEVKVPSNETILTAALDAGLDAPFMCESGVCSSCRAKILNGKVKMRACYALSDREIAEGYILSCQAEMETDSVQLTYDI